MHKLASESSALHDVREGIRVKGIFILNCSIELIDPFLMQFVLTCRPHQQINRHYRLLSLHIILNFSCPTYRHNITKKRFRFIRELVELFD